MGTFVYLIQRFLFDCLDVDKHITEDLNKIS